MGEKLHSHPYTGKIMEELRDLNDGDSKARNIINVNQHSFSEKYGLCSKPDFG